MNVENVSTMEINARTGHIHRGSGRRRAIRVRTRGVRAFAGIAVKVELYRDALSYGRIRAGRWVRDVIRTIAQAAAGRTNSRRSDALNCECETIAARVGKLEAEVRCELRDVDWGGKNALRPSVPPPSVRRSRDPAITAPAFNVSEFSPANPEAKLMLGAVAVVTV